MKRKDGSYFYYLPDTERKIKYDDLPEKKKEKHILI